MRRPDNQLDQVRFINRFNKTVAYLQSAFRAFYRQFPERSCTKKDRVTAVSHCPPRTRRKFMRRIDGPEQCVRIQQQSHTYLRWGNIGGSLNSFSIEGSKFQQWGCSLTWPLNWPSLRLPDF